jgi:hypothetical protein
LFIAATHFIHGAVIPTYMLDAERLGILLRRLAGNQVLNMSAATKRYAAQQQDALKSFHQNIPLAKKSPDRSGLEVRQR